MRICPSVAGSGSRRTAGGHSVAQVLACLGETEQGEDRHQQRGRIEQQSDPGIPGPDAKPEVDTQAEMHPGNQQSRRLPGHAVRRRRDVLHDPGIVEVDAPDRQDDPRAGDMRNEQKGKQQSKTQLECLAGGHAERAAPVERQKRQREVDQDGAVEQDGSRHAAPQEIEPSAPGLHRGKRDEPQGMIEKMRGEKTAENESGHQPKLTYADGRRGDGRPRNGPGLLGHDPNAVTPQDARVKLPLPARRSRR